MECLYAVNNMRMKHGLCSPPPSTMNRKKGYPLSADFFFLTPTRSQYNAIKVAGRSLACGGSKECCVWQEILVEEGMRCLSSVSEALGQICHTFL